jgi:hypothetical protein
MYFLSMDEAKKRGKPEYAVTGMLIYGSRMYRKRLDSQEGNKR